MKRLLVKKKAKTQQGRLLVRNPNYKAPTVQTKGDLEGELIYYPFEGSKVPALVTSQQSDGLLVKLAFRDSNGVLVVSDDNQFLEKVEGIEKLQAAKYVERKVKSFRQDATMDMKAAEVKNDDGIIIDYRDVVVSGIASTPANDRDNERILPGAYSESLAVFKTNPVMLVDHTNACAMLAGSYTKLSANEKGLMIEGRVSNAPDIQSIRFKLMEGHLKALSVGGLFQYGVEPGTIEKVYLWEISLVPVPANPEALISSRSITLADAKSMMDYMRKAA